MLRPQRSWGCPISGSVQCQAGQGLVQAGPVIPAHGRRRMGWALRSLPTPFWFVWPLSAGLEFIFHTFIIMTPLCVSFPSSRWESKTKRAEVLIYHSHAEITGNFTLLQVFGHLNDLIQDSVEKNVGLPTPTHGPNPRSGSSKWFFGPGAQQLMAEQTVSMRTLPTKFLEIPSHSLIDIIKGFAYAAALCNIYTTSTLPSCRSQQDQCCYRMKWEAVHEKCLRVGTVSFSTPFSHEWEIYRNQTRIPNSFKIDLCCKNKTTVTDNCFLLKASNYQQQQVNTLTCFLLFPCSYH